MPGKVEQYLLDKIKAEGTIHLTLIDPEKVTTHQASKIVENSRSSGTSAIMIGGSTFVSQSHLDEIIKTIKDAVKLPTILFPNNITGISQYADAIWFMSLLNSTDTYFVIGAQVLGAPLVKKYGLEPIPMGYVIVGEGGTAGIMGKAIAVPYNKPELAAAHALAGQYLGMHFVYLEGGSGAKEPVPPEMIRAVKHFIDVPVLVGGGIRT
ncbi:MAG TPA: geranylgeranylglyceryl/heptaprenylglyceryl phosphate synthase, partial [Candidatus Bathyarchaeia archaeon]